MASKHICIITSSIEGRGAYGVTKDTSENVYISVSAAEAEQLEEFDEIEVIAVPNDRPEPPLRALRIRHLTKTE